MKITRKFTHAGKDPFASVEWGKRSSRITNPDGSVVFEMKDAEVPETWSQLATDIMVSKYFRKAGVPKADGTSGPETSARQVIHRLAGCWRHWGEKHGYFDTAEDAQAFYDELAYMMVHQMCAPNSPQWFNTGLNFAYGITGPAQGHWIVDPKTGEPMLADDAYTHPQPHACQPYEAPISTPQGPVFMGDIVTKNLVGLELYDGTKDGVGTTRVKAVKSNGDKPVYAIVLKNGVRIEATADHLVLAMKDRRTEGDWLRVDALTPGMRMRLSTATTVQKDSSERDVEEAALAGWLQGDGFVGQYTEGTNRSLTVEFMTIDQDEFDFVMAGVGRIFEGVHHHVRDVESQDGELQIRRIRLYGEKLRPFVEKYGLLRGDSDLAVPAAVRAAGASAQRAYLCSLFQADGTVRLRERETRTSDVVLTTVSPELAAGVQALLLNLGIYSRVQRGSESRENRRTPYFVSIGYADARAKFRDQIGFISDDKKQKLATACSETFPGKSLPALRDEEIVRIELTGTRPVYDIQTESGQYLCNNVIVHNCFIQSVDDDLVNEGGIMDLWVREARLFKYGSGTGTNFSQLRGDSEKLSGGGRSSGLMSWLKIGDRAASAIKSGGTTRRAAKMVCLDMDHPDIQDFVNWKVREEIKVQAMVEGMKLLHKADPSLAEQCEKLKLKLDYDFNGEAYQTVSGQNSNNSVRIPDSFFDAIDSGDPWQTSWRTNGKPAKKFDSRGLWDDIAYAAWRCADPGVQFDTTINAWHTCPNAGRINASNPCVTGDTLVATTTGLKRIADLVGNTADVIAGDGQASFVDRIFPTGTKQVYELCTAAGYRLRLTGDHRVWTLNRGDVPACELTVDDVVQLRGSGFGSDFLPPAVAELLGAAIGDGCITRGESEDHLFVTLGGDERELAEYLRDAVDESKSLCFAGDRRATRGTSVIETQSGLRVGTAAGGVLAKLERYAVLDRGSHLKSFTDAVHELDRATVAAVLRGLFTADGTVADYGEKSQYVSLDSTSLELLRQVQMLLLGFDVKAKIYENRRALGQHTSTMPDGKGGSAEYPVRQMHSLRISRSSRVRFEKEVGFIPCSVKAVRLASLNERVAAYRDTMTDRVASLTPMGIEPVFDLTEPRTSHFVANGLVVHNCSEYMFLDNTACNLASLNVMKFYDAKSRAFDVERFEHGVDLWTMVLEISVLMAAFPSREIAELSYKYRTTGLGYANLGAMLMQAGVAYDSDEGRALCACLTSILTGRSYRTSALLAKEHGPFPGYAPERENMLRVIRNHRRAAHGIPRDAEEYEQLRITPVPIDHNLILLSAKAGTMSVANSATLLSHAVRAWDEALDLGEKYGYRNAQTTVIAPTGTIGLLMDCDTTGVEPDFALVKFKKLAGGGYFKIANDSVRPALRTLGYSDTHVREIMAYLLGALSLDVQLPAGVKGAKPGETLHHFLHAKGLPEADLRAITESLPGVFELSFAFGGWSISPEGLKACGIDPEKAKADMGFNLLGAFGLTAAQIEKLNLVICGAGTIEGAPHLRHEHLSVFDCANKCGKLGVRYIAAEGHIRMMAAAQPFISGAISKTINLPNDATVEDIKNCYRLSWELGLKANALYRDGCKLSQPLSSTADEAKKETGRETAAAEATVTPAPATEAPAAVAPKQTTQVPQQIQEMKPKATRRRLADTRRSLTHKFNVAGHEGYLTVGLYEDGQPGELFITMSKEGSTIGGLMDSLGTATSVSLQYGVPVKSLVDKFSFQRFEPAGITENPDIPFAKSLVDYIFRWMGMQFIPGYAEEYSPRFAAEREAAQRGPTTVTVTGGSVETQTRTVISEMVVQVRTQEGALDSYMKEVSDAPACDVCGNVTVRSGTCYKCLNCGNSLGCS
ncbi:MAG: LAGLIDADG family homing endonuclease [Phycisphaerales bacterium]